MSEKSKKVVISGYYGFNNFGDEAILQVIVREIKHLSNNTEIVVLSKNPELTSDKLKVKSVNRLNLLQVIKEFISSDLLISGGGSLLQDVTGPFTLYYYLGIMLLAKLLGNKVIIYAQGIGPIDTKTGKLFTKCILKTANTVTVRDIRSQHFLEDLKVKSDLTSDPVWLGINDDVKNTKEDDYTIGINLRPWKNLDSKKLQIIAEALVSSIETTAKLVILPLQYNQDYEICIEFKTLLNKLNPELNIEVIAEELAPSEYDKIIQSCNSLIAMRFHALISSLAHNIKTFGISYDPKVTSLMEESNTNYIHINELENSILTEKLKAFLSEDFKPHTTEFVNKNIKLARENVNKLKCLLEI